MTIRIAALILIIPTLAFGADVWVVRGVAATPLDQCRAVGWEAYAIVHNRSDASATLRFLHGSNGGYDGAPQAGALAAGQSRLAQDLGLASAPEHTVLWVDHLEVPDGLVTVEGRLEQTAIDQCDLSGRPPTVRAIGKLRVPVFTRLVAAGEEQIHYGTDLGSVRTRVNVAIYNAGVTVATAAVRLEKPLCSEAAFTRTLTVPPDRIEQFSLGEVIPCAGSLGRKEWVSLITVTVDQPSLSVISTLSNEQPPAVGGAITAY